MMRVALAVATVAIAIAAIGLVVAARRTAPVPAPRDAGDHAAPHTIAPTVAGDAPRAVAVTAAADAAEPEPAAELVTLRESGSAAEPWVPQATAILDVLGRAAEVRGSGCYVAGCGAEIVFASTTELARRRTDVEASADYQRWTGGKRWTAPVTLPDGRVSIALILYRPD